MHKILALIAALALTPSAWAQETAPQPSLTLELNALQAAESGCRITFLATNALGAVLDKASVELALFDAAGTIERIVTLDFKALAEGKTKVLQFELSGLDCSGLGRILVNDITACEGPALPAEACSTGLVTTTRTTVTFGA